MPGPPLSRPRWRGLLAAEASSVTYALVTLLFQSSLGVYVKTNRGGAGLRFAPLACAAGVAVVVALAAGASRSAERWKALSVRCLPLLLVGALPPLLSHEGFKGRAFEVMVLCALLVVGAERAWLHRSDANAEGQAPGEATSDSDASSTKISARWAHVAVAALVIGYVTAASWASIRLHDKLYTSLFDLGMFENLLWNTIHGVHGIAADRRYFGEHAEFILYALVPIYRSIPRTETLLVVQSALLGGAAVPLYLFARRLLESPWQALGLAAAFLVYPAVHGPNFYDFHFLTLSVFFVLWAGYFFVAGRWVLFSASVLLALACREDVSVGGAAIGLALSLGSTRWRWVGATLAATSIVWFVAVKLIWMKSLGGDSFVGYYAALTLPERPGFLGVLETVVTNPAYSLAQILTKEKLLLALQLLVPLAFLPIRRAHGLFLLLPGMIVIGLSTGAAALTQVHFQYVCHFVPYVFLAAVVALVSFSRRKRMSAFVALGLGSLATSVHFGPAFGDTYVVSFHEVDFRWAAADRRRSEDLKAVLTHIPAQASVAASDPEGAHVGRRRHLRGIKEGVGEAEFLVYGIDGLRWGGGKEVIGALRSGQFGLVDQRGQFAVLQRGADTRANSQEERRVLAAVGTR